MDIVEKLKMLMLATGAAPVMWLLIALSVVSVAIVFERAWFFHQIEDDLEALVAALSNRLRAGDMEGAKLLLKASPSAEAAVVMAGLLEASNGAAAAREAMSGAFSLQKLNLERRLAILGTLGNNAPFVGLFGTVIGIVMAFEQLGHSGGMSGASAPTEVMSSIAEALVATAIGLLVAIPAVAAFNWFQRKIRETSGRTDALSRVLLAYLESPRVKSEEA